jgi:hypothetical protein
VDVILGVIWVFLFCFCFVFAKLDWWVGGLVRLFGFVGNFSENLLLIAL